MFMRADAFFAEVIIPIEKTHRAARRADAHVAQLIQTLRRRTAESSTSIRRLQLGVSRRQAVEMALAKSRKNYFGLLHKSNLLNDRLRKQTHAILSVQEVERQKTSRLLNDEIAQSLLALNVHLLILKTSAGSNTTNLTKEIAVTQRMVQESVQMFQQVAKDLDVNYEA